MKNHLFSYLTLCLAIGIYVSDSQISSTNLRIYFVLLLFTFFFAQFIHNQLFKTLGFLLQFIVLGALLHSSSNSSINQPFKEEKQSKIQSYFVLERFKSSPHYLKFKVRNLTSGEVGLLHVKDQSHFIYPHDTLIIYGRSYGLTSPKNPYQFDYSLYLKRKKINHTIYADYMLKHLSNHQYWKKVVARSKEQISLSMQQSGYSTEARSIVSSMLLGDRSEISEDIQASYIATGVVHILSISGLHVVMIFIILQFILSPILHFKNGQRVRVIVALIFIWIFAFYVELMPPVFRSALMITIYYISELLKRPKNIYHTIALSAFIILVCEPNYLFDVGFQLSFSAVFFIVWLHPLYRLILNPRHRILTYFYNLTCTSISAQFGTLPFATYYFHQFSGLFLLGNIFLVPASFLMIIGGIVVIIFVVFHLHVPVYVALFNQYIELCNSYIQWLAVHDAFILKQVYITTCTAILILVIIIAVRPFILRRSKGAMVLILGALLGIQTNRIMAFNQLKNSRELVIFHHYKSSIIGIRNGFELYILHPKELDLSQANRFILQPYQTHQRIQKTTFLSMDSVVQNATFSKTKSFLFVDKYVFFIGENLTKIPENLDYLLVRNSSFKPDQYKTIGPIKRVIADGSNYPSYVSTLDSIFQSKGHSVLYPTSEKGSFRLKF